MKRLTPILFTLTFAAITAAQGEAPTLTIGHASADFTFEAIPRPAVNDVGAKATLEVIDGSLDRNSAPLKALNDPILPTSSDDPKSNVFFAAGSDGGRLLVDLGRPVDIASIATYSWHRTDRAPQVYTLYATTDLSRKPARPTDPSTAGWTKLADVDTRTARAPQHAALLSGAIGTYRYLLLDVRPTQTRDRFGHTFFSDLDVTEVGAKEPWRGKPAQPRIAETFTTEDKKYTFIIDSTQAPDLTEWSRTELAPVLVEWYPKLVAMLPGDGFTAPDGVYLEYRTDMPRGVPAYASGNRVALGVDFYRAQLDNEAKGCAVHELVHVVQLYALARRNPDATRTPGWVTEGIADYIRWFLYEPEKNGAAITRRNLLAARYDASYRITANFIDYVVRTHDPEKTLLKNLNTAAREGRYTDDLWQKWTGHNLADLNTQWLQHHRQRLLNNELKESPHPASPLSQSGRRPQER